MENQQTQSTFEPEQSQPVNNTQNNVAPSGEKNGWKIFAIVASVLLVAAVGCAGYLFMQVNNLNNELANKDTDNSGIVDDGDEEDGSDDTATDPESVEAGLLKAFCVASLEDDCLSAAKVELMGREIMDSTKNPYQRVEAAVSVGGHGFMSKFYRSGPTSEWKYLIEGGSAGGMSCSRFTQLAEVAFAFWDAECYHQNRLGESIRSTVGEFYEEFCATGYCHEDMTGYQG